MSYFARVHMINHGLDKTDVGKVFHYNNGKFYAILHDEMMKKDYGDWTVITEIIDADNFECFSGEGYILNKATNFEYRGKTAGYMGEDC